MTGRERLIAELDDLDKSGLIVGDVLRRAIAAIREPGPDLRAVALNAALTAIEKIMEDHLIRRSDGHTLSSAEFIALTCQALDAALALTAPPLNPHADIVAFVARVNTRAEADMLAGNPITGAHHRAIEAELAALTAHETPATS